MRIHAGIEVTPDLKKGALEQGDNRDHNAMRKDWICGMEK